MYNVIQIDKNVNADGLIADAKPLKEQNTSAKKLERHGKILI